ncbi:16S rRNA (cytosine(1402)-N(4))-methyltransferase RsmH [Candidatus Falkowbacteria bacterium]|nr:16S rRNA (cytosine(1402)-N(4))-methyltransferase RsmH [Candidatus Falkowbacteria bacterium]MBT7006876.1 16S rRNA (cytosine(1402)-N(4))-methyltransferase RsmH [Candidatus Falkowbacteria bacterium]
MTKHKPVLLEEVLEFLNPQANQNIVDCTLGGGGHAKAILERTSPNGILVGLDWDKEAIKKAKVTLKKYKNRVIYANSSYVDIQKVIYDKKIDKVDAILLDLGLSSDQLEGDRGFSFLLDDALDMRFNQEENELTAAEIINNYSAGKIERLLRENAEEEHARRIVKAITEARKRAPIETSKQLADLIEFELPRRGRIHPATKTFQALRIAVNSEFENVKKGLEHCLEVLSPGGRLGVISFHSLEDKIVKQFFKTESKDCLCPRELPVCRCNHTARVKKITKKPVGSTELEIKENPRSRSAKLRVIEKI